MGLLLLLTVVLAALAGGAFFWSVSPALAVVAALVIAGLCALAIGTAMVTAGGPGAKPARRFGEPPEGR